ncbi:redoxin domain-containing protein [Sanguibacter suaedae]|uniref:Redoxin domain-containing protein n=1 Tax=Sanguibacter suaedae TaxID=2795737 RepID=A0A934IAQ4_9MICO|nr:redoxin domain-containing protein [Sanguibacter suaedae]MBI9114315.1 redoxin domain-containing protein [Sanguibacter suaedae]
MPGALAVGDAAPGFDLVDTHGTPVHLADLRGAPVLLVFFPFAFSRTCTDELRDLRDAAADLDAAGASVLAVSCDPMFALKAWAEDEGFRFPLLSDFWPHGQVARRYGVLDETDGHALRGSFLIDAAGNLVWSTVVGRSDRRDIAAHRAALTLL